MPASANRGTRVVFWLVSLVVAPSAGFFMGLSVSGSGKASDVLAWVLLLGLPATLTLLMGRWFGLPMAEVGIAAALSTGMSALALIALLWYLFEVVGLS